MIWIILLFILLFIPILFFPKCKQKEGHVDCLIVLGCPTYADGTMSLTQKLRVEKAAQSIQQYHIPVCICTGGAAHNKYTEAQVMANYLKTLVDVEVVLEDKSTTTYENMKYCQELCKTRNYKKIGVLTSAYHSNRAYAMSKKFFDDIVIFDAPYHFTFKKFVREFLSRYQYLYIELRNYLKDAHLS